MFIVAEIKEDFTREYRFPFRLLEEELLRTRFDAESMEVPLCFGRGAEPDQLFSQVHKLNSLGKIVYKLEPKCVYIKKDTFTITLHNPGTNGLLDARWKLLQTGIFNIFCMEVRFSQSLPF